MAEAAKTLRELEDAFFAKTSDLIKCQALVNSFKLSLLKLPITPPADISNSEVRKHLETARYGYELAVLISLHQKDLESFELNFVQLKPYYFDYGSVLSESPRKWPILGLHLLKLLAQSRIAEFHTELELLPILSHSNEFIAYPITLEQELMEGSYRALWDASSSVPFPEYQFFVDFLVNAARDNIAECAEKAYQKLSVTDGMKVLKIPDLQKFAEFCSNRGWQVTNGVIQFRPATDPTFFIPSHEMMKHTLGYATELERIV